MTTNKFCGIVYKPKQGSLVHLPLDEIRVQALVIDVSARVTLSQVFVNDSKVPTPRAKYVFPVPARGAVCAFEIRTQDGRVIKGIAKEKEKAAQEHAKAIRQGRLTSLVEWATDDVFTISIGSIPPEQKLTTRLTYTVDLMNDDLADQIRFQLPMCVGERYGQLPDTMLDASNPSRSTRVRVVIGIQTKGDIQSIISPSHPSIRALPFQSDEEPSRNRMVVTYESSNFLTQDFVMNVQAEGLDEPRCFAEKDQKHGSVSMQLTVVPKFDLPPIPSQEYIFLVDRSGSMAGTRIETAKRTLVMLLRSLPAAGTTFNIFSFGTSSSKMFPSSRNYTQASLNEATQHVDQMSADYGGTEIRSALDSVFKSRKRTSPTSLFVLTDGETYDIDATIKTVTKAVAMSTTEAPLRVFTLGIGEGASSAMCEGIARAGNGVCLMATSSENILGKCAKLVRASRTFILKNISVDWGTPVNKPAKSGFGFHSATRPRECLQSPTKIESLYPGLRLVVTAMIKDEAFKIPEQVILSGQRDGNGEVIEFRIPVQLVQPAEEDDTIPLVNTLAARRIITELEDPKNESQHTEEQKKATIIRFGEEYQLASRYTSFVAIGDHLSEYQKGSSKGKEKSSKREKVGHIKGSSLSNLVGNFFEAPSTEVDVAVDHNDSEDEEDEDWDFGSVTPPIEQAQMRRRHASSSAPRIPLVGGGLPTRPTGLSMFGMGRSSARTAPPPPPAFSSAPVPPPLSKKAKMWSAPPPPPIAPGGGGYCDAIQDPSILGGQEEYGSSQAKDILPTFGGEEGIDNDMSFSPRGRNAVRTPTSETSVTRLVRLQAFDGSFTLSGEFIQIVGENVAKGAQPQGVPDILWATAVAIAYIRKYLADQPELSDSLVEKAMDFVSQSLLGQGVDFKALVTKAKGLL